MLRISETPRGCPVSPSQEKIYKGWLEGEKLFFVVVGGRKKVLENPQVGVDGAFSFSCYNENNNNNNAAHGKNNNNNNKNKKKKNNNNGARGGAGPPLSRSRVRASPAPGAALAGAFRAALATTALAAGLLLRPRLRRMRRFSSAVSGKSAWRLSACCY